MKFVLAFLLIFTVLADFSVASYDMACCESACDEASICADTHLTGHDSDHDSNSNSSHGCHNHADHSHIAVIDSVLSGLVNSVAELTVKYPKFNIQNINFFLNEISRPPIS